MPERRITKSNVDRLSAGIAMNGKLSVRTKSMFIENYQKPFYFCLDTDLADRKDLMTQMNEYYQARQSELFQLNLHQHPVSSLFISITFNIYSNS
jgi:hypothetical protein